LIAEARSEKIRHMDEVHAAQKKVADLESRYCLLYCCLMLGNVIIKLHHLLFEASFTNVCTCIISLSVFFQVHFFMSKHLQLFETRFST
jgi:hypothetical protein